MAKRRIDSRFNQKTHRPGSKNFGKIIRSLQFPAGKLASTVIPRLHQRITRMARKTSRKHEIRISIFAFSVGAGSLRLNLH